MAEGPGLQDEQQAVQPSWPLAQVSLRVQPDAALEQQHLAEVQQEAAAQGSRALQLLAQLALAPQPVQVLASAQQQAQPPASDPAG